MTTTQKICSIVGVTSFALWLLLNIGNDDFGFGLDYLFNSTGDVITFAIAIGCAVGFFLFTDKK